MLEKNYDAASIEQRIAKKWEARGAFKAGMGSKSAAQSFCVMLPPPNVTGSLHMGHALNTTIQDIVVRFQRMRGKNVLWQPGMDHAGIATQMVVERQLAERQEPTRQEMGREKFVERIWEWRYETGGVIANQLRRLGVSCDWSRERFTMDDGLSEAVREVFVTLYKQGLIYRDKRLVNWDPKLLTAISDLEVEQKEVKGHLWHFRYPLEGKLFDPSDATTFITVATTRPETMLGDTGIAVNPEDDRYRNLIGQNAILPLVGRRLSIVADAYANPDEGSGAVKITPAHDFNDFEVGRRNNLRLINIFTEKAEVFLHENEAFFEGVVLSDALKMLVKDLDQKDRFIARDQIVSLMEEKGYLVTVDDHPHTVPYGDRSGVPIEPFLTDQWYVNAAELAKPAIEAVHQGKTQFIPDSWQKTYFNWMQNIQPWCVSRQLWWGHQIPAWYGPDGRVFVEKSEEEALNSALSHYGEVVNLTRDPDVLDTWFSSALWPFSTLGWPNKTPELATFYPTSLSVTGFDIIFFWVARMMMMGLHFMGEVPFPTVYVHALVRDQKGAKMSKSKGNIIDPLELIDQYSADSLRFTLAIMAAQGRDVKLDPSRIAGYRNFATKLWNATRFAQMNGVKHDPDFKPEKAKLALNRWILTELSKTVVAVTTGIENYKFNESASALYRFIWNTLCDWYLELLKPIFQGSNEDAKNEVQACTAWVLDEVYKLLHPFMPHMTEELWSLTETLGMKREDMLALIQWPEASFSDEEAASDINWLIDAVSAIRSVRFEMNIPAAALAPLVIVEGGELTLKRVELYESLLKKLARVETISFSDKAPALSAQMILGEAIFCLPLGQLIDLEAERARLMKDVSKIEQDIEKLSAKLSNPKFIENAKPEIVEVERNRIVELRTAQKKISLALERLV
ncbi:valine--tRNA ligase [Bartonella henselae]|uniref:Valine--tRNA ligase n=5 Tax=Bartonella TaxID=773 RepID=SYV_BARHE|nr:valine--tRNA ligase [Bartonella henselae]Q6G2V3.1 RecName: Full=Valine--tRNA ligase; AltName: Full=Valyl-tRNA synthetase; Short=ValRS [Bartonella henselae str. Houston-1]ATP12567.1 valine--tRNA ligase [Bartonella henselae]ETS08180.1 valyl-tRNA synthetase [Bartonella henselae JK 50]ETS08728.1 valyl-tRNA synthetase [Bartonella henselae JK 51]ETS11280.1 valyl-tRNA synthetase [Bartonella henselae JK 42]ETS15285.1 valyl-tRNA synthetase [Bartonella henselae JK 41]